MIKQLIYSLILLLLCKGCAREKSNKVFDQDPSVNTSSKNNKNGIDHTIGDINDTRSIDAGNEEYSGSREEFSNSFEDFKNKQLSELETFEDKNQENFKVFKDKVEKKWKEFRSSTETVFVRYNKKLDARSSIDFKNGEVLIEVQVDIANDNSLPSKEIIQKKIIKELNELNKETDDQKRSILSDQLPKDILKRKGDQLDASKILNYLSDHGDKIIRFFSRDMKKRANVSVQIPLVNDHLQIRAEKYRTMVINQADRFGIDPALVMAIIHVESHFNPRAMSHVPAYGLMQLVPGSGGKDAYERLYGDNWAPSERYLFDPRKNIELGCQYLSILKDNYFDNVDSDRSKEFCMISAYNTGPGNVSVAFIGKKKVSESIREINKLSPSGVKRRLLKKLPYKETKQYLNDVIDKKELYSS